MIPLHNMNLLKNPTPENLLTCQLTWDHAPEKWEALPGEGLRVFVPAQVDYFQDPAGKIFNDSAPYLWMPIRGDFIARTHVRPAFTTAYDAGALMVRHDSTHWAKLCFESTDFGTTAAVSVVTNGVSDDANGVNLTCPDLWLQMARQGDVFAFHYSVDGNNWRMVRLFKFQMPDPVKMGLVAQCPIGPETSTDFLYFSIEQKQVKDIRAGV
jgi:regulation of enolase protein 1 (concanavalin A-like superfamily)